MNKRNGERWSQFPIFATFLFLFLFSIYWNDGESSFRPTHVQTTTSKSSNVGRCLVVIERNKKKITHPINSPLTIINNRNLLALWHWKALTLITRRRIHMCPMPSIARAKERELVIAASGSRWYGELNDWKCNVYERNKDSKTSKEHTPHTAGAYTKFPFANH